MVWDGLRFVIVALPGLFSYLFFFHLRIWSEPLFQIGTAMKNKKKRIANSVDPDETVYYEPSYQDLQCLQKLLWSAGLKWLNGFQNVPPKKTDRKVL